MKKDIKDIKDMNKKEYKDFLDKSSPTQSEQTEFVRKELLSSLKSNPKELLENMKNFVKNYKKKDNN